MNRELADILIEIANLLSQADIDWKPQAYRKAAKSIINLDKNVKDIYDEGGLKALEKIDGVGARIAKKIEEYVKTGKIKYNGPRTDVVVKTPKDRGPARDYSDVIKIAKKVVRSLKNSGAATRIMIAGSLRRKKEKVHDIDLLATSNNASELMESFTIMPDVRRVLARGLSKTMLVLDNSIQVDLRIVPAESWGSALLYFTGDKGFNIYLRRVAIKLGYKLSEYGLFDRKSEKRLAGDSEKEIFAKLGVKYVSPPKRVA
jgi:DNA polymerase (family 10)